MEVGGAKHSLILMQKHLRFRVQLREVPQGKEKAKGQH